MSFAPLDSEVLFSTTIREGPLVFAVWCAILASKDQDGFTGLTPESLAALMSDPKSGRIQRVEEIEAAWGVLSSPDPGSRNQEFQGRRIIPTGDGRWLVVSHEKYRVKYNRAVRIEQLRIAKARQREKEKRQCVMSACERPGVSEVDGVWVCSLHAGEDVETTA